MTNWERVHSCLSLTKRQLSETHITTGSCLSLTPRQAVVSLTPRQAVI